MAVEEYLFNQFCCDVRKSSAYKEYLLGLAKSLGYKKIGTLTLALENLSHNAKNYHSFGFF